MLIALDFDGVLHDPHTRNEGYKMGVPIAGAVEAVQRLWGAGHTLVVHTVRDDSDWHVSNWLSYFGFPSMWVTNIKPNADVFIDDKAVRFTDWQTVLQDFSEQSSEEVAGTR